MNRETDAPARNRRGLVVIVVALLFLLSGIALLPRLAMERAGRVTGIIVDYRDVAALASRENKPVEAIWSAVAEKGATGLMVSELTGEQLSQGALPLYYGVPSGLPESPKSVPAPGVPATAIYLPESLPEGGALATTLTKRFPGASVETGKRGTIAILPRMQDQLLTTGVLPDLDGLLLAEKLRIPVFYRVAPAIMGDTKAAIDVLEKLFTDYPSIQILSPTGEVALGFPDLAPLAQAAKGKGKSVAMVEFSRQIGAARLNWLAYPNLLSLHSVTNEEVVGRRITRLVLHERFLRAVKERAVRLLVFRPSAIEAADDSYTRFLLELGALSGSLADQGYAIGWPKPFAPWRQGFVGAVALALAFVFTSLRYLRRWFPVPGREDESRGRPTLSDILPLLVITMIVALVLRFLPSSAKIVGALSAVLIVTEGAFIALDGWRKPLGALVGSFLFVVAGGLAIAAFFSDPTYVLRLRTFSGVKATLLLPPILVFLADLKSREHPESLGAILRRPPLWGELALMGILLVGAVLVLFRSDNVQVVPALEIQVREFLERVLVARPRNKELFIGYPSLMVWYFLRSRDLWPRYREAFRLGTVLGFSSAVNSFCHFHTPLSFILFRQFNGLWTGVVVGIIAVALLRWVLLPLWRRYGSVVAG